MKKLLFVFLGVVVVLTIFLWRLIDGVNSHQLQVFVLNIGQGDSILVRLPTGENILIDGGPDESVLRELAELLPLYERKIDAVILTHPHADHLNGLIEVMKHYEVRSILFTGVFYNSATYDEFVNVIAREKIPVFFAHADQDFQIGGVDLDVVYPLHLVQGDRYGNLNNSSISFRLLSSHGIYYFSGDLEKEGEAELLQSEQDLHADVLKAGHHGSRTSSTEPFLDVVKPEFAIISCGINNKFKHPHPETIEHFQKRNITLYRTDLYGIIEVESDGASLNVHNFGK